MMTRRLRRFGLGLLRIAIPGSVLLGAILPISAPAHAQTSGPPSRSTPRPPVNYISTEPSGEDVCDIVMSMPGAADTDELLDLLETSRPEIISDLTAMRRNMEQYDAEGYGWQNVMDGSSGLAPQPGAWMVGALRMACARADMVEAQPMTAITGTVSYRQRIALPPDAVLAVTLEEIARPGMPSTMIAGRTIPMAGQSVPIAFSIVYDPDEINERYRYVVRAQVFYDSGLQWTSTTTDPVITQNNPTEVEIELAPVN